MSADERLVIVSADSHAAIPPEMWDEYVETDYRQHLPALHEEASAYFAALKVISEYSPELMEVLDDEGVLRDGGRRGASYRDVRIQEMDREGVAAEIVFENDASCVPLWMSPSNRWQPEDVRAAGGRAYNRWAADHMIGDDGRLLVLGDISSCGDVEAALRELRYLADEAFFGVHVPGMVGDPAMPALHDPYFDPVWSACEEAGLVVGLHAGFGIEQGALRPLLEDMAKKSHDAGVGLADFTNDDTSFFVRDTRPRRALAQMLLGGVFDRHPRLKVTLTELRGDWIPSTLRLLDELWSEGDLPTRQKPSEQWEEHCVVGMSMMKLSEVPIRHEIGLDHLMFGRDYPHAEGTWPKTLDHVKALLAGVPEAEVRQILGGNAIRAFDLDEAKLTAIAEEIRAPRYADLFDGAPVDPRLTDAFGERSGFHKPAEVADPDEIRDLVAADFAPPAA